MKLSLEDVDDYATGAALLGTGGGGDPYIGGLLLKQALNKNGAIDLIDVMSVPDDALLICSAMIGAPTVMMEKLPNGGEALNAIRTLEEYLGRKAYGILAAEIGGLNALLPLVVGSNTGLPVINGDGMGRAFPELQMITYSILGNSSSPLTLADEFGNTVLVTAANDKSAEKLARSAVVAMGGSALMACYPMSGADAKRCVLRETLTIALGVGRVIRGTQSGTGRTVDSVIEYLSETNFYGEAGLLFEGKVTDLVRESTSGFAIGSINIDGIGEFKGAMSIQFQNENLIAYRNGELCAIVPDLICIVDLETAEPITTEGLKYGQRVSVIGIAAPDDLRTPDALAVVGPACFGLNEEFVAIEQLLVNDHNALDKARSNS